MELIISMAALVVALAALIVTLTSQQTRRHFHAYSECRRVVGQGGEELDQWSFSAGHTNTLIGNTIGRVYITFASARFARQQREREAMSN